MTEWWISPKTHSRYLEASVGGDWTAWVSLSFMCCRDTEVVVREGMVRRGRVEESVGVLVRSRGDTRATGTWEIWGTKKISSLNGVKGHFTSPILYVSRFHVCFRFIIVHVQDDMISENHSQFTCYIITRQPEGSSQQQVMYHHPAL